MERFSKEWIQPVLHGRDRRDRLCLADLGDAHVRKPDPPDLPLLPQALELSDTLRQRNLGIRRVELVQRQPLDPQGPERPLGGGAQVRRTAVLIPCAAVAHDAALGGDRHRTAVTAPARERLGDQALVVADLGLVEAVGVGGIDQRDARVERGVNDADGLRLGRPAIGDGEVHSAVADRGHLRRAGTKRPPLHVTPSAVRRNVTSSSRTS